MEAATIQQADAEAQGTALVLTDEQERDVVADRLQSAHDGWNVDVRALPSDHEEAGVAADEAIGLASPSLVLFIGAALPVDPGAAGGVVVADRVSSLKRLLGPRVRPRRGTRRANPNLVRLAASAARASPDDPVAATVAVGWEAIALWREAGREAWQRSFEDAVAVDVSGWDFVFGYYDDEDLPALAILGLTETDRHDDHALAGAYAHAAAFAGAVLDIGTPAGLRTDPFDATAEQGERRHLVSDAELLAHESTQGIVQRPYVDSALAQRASHTAATPRTRKDAVSAAILHAYLDDRGVAPADLSLRIELRGNRLEFQLHSERHDLNFFNMKVGSTELKKFGTGPKQYRENLTAAIAKIARRPDKSDVEQLEMLGNQLYNDLFPDELKAAYAEFREKDVRTLMITSDEPWIPWELVKPHAPEFPDDDFLCASYAMGRWLNGRGPKHRFNVEVIASLEAGSVEGRQLLPTAREECEYISSLAARLAVEDLSPKCASYERVRSLLLQGEREVHLWHVAAHGELDAADPDESIVVFEDRPWKAGDLSGKLGYGIQRARPLVFFNACLVGQQDFALTRLGGWPNAWVVQNQCGGFIAPQWSVSSKLATIFSRAFYDAIVGDDESDTPGVSLGEAARVARKAVREANPVDPAWLSYAVYAHPNARVRFRGPGAKE